MASQRRPARFPSRPSKVDSCAQPLCKMSDNTGCKQKARAVHVYGLSANWDFSQCPLRPSVRMRTRERPASTPELVSSPEMKDSWWAEVTSELREFPISGPQPHFKQQVSDPKTDPQAAISSFMIPSFQIFWLSLSFLWFISQYSTKWWISCMQYNKAHISLQCNIHKYNNWGSSIHQRQTRVSLRMLCPSVNEINSFETKRNQSWANPNNRHLHQILYYMIFVHDWNDMLLILHQVHIFQDTTLVDDYSSLPEQTCCETMEGFQGPSTN